VTVEIVLVLAILVIALVLLIGDWLRMDLVSLMVLSSLAVLGLVTPAQAVSGFSNPAVITVWAMFIMSEGLTRAGIADQIGRGVLRVAGHDGGRHRRLGLPGQPGLAPGEYPRHGAWRLPIRGLPEARGAADRRAVPDRHAVAAAGLADVTR
jgi:hypothetical protein